MYDVAVVGGGIIGVATGRELLLRYPRMSIVLLEKEPTIAAHQSSHNSGVVHSGIYYRPGSLKAQLCSDGARAMRAYCERRAIPLRIVGKLIVAVEESELPALDELLQRGRANGVEGLEMLDAGQIREREPFCRGIRAIYSPKTGIVDFAVVTTSLARDFRECGGEIRTGHAVRAIDCNAAQTTLRCANGATIVARYVVTCAGLHSDRVAAMTGDAGEPRIVPFRGSYLLLKPEKQLVNGCIYPVPDPRFPFLGVHVTPRINGEVWLGPNAVLAFAREGYRFSTFSPRDLLETVTYRGFIKLATKHLRTGVGEMYRDSARAAYVKALRRYIPELDVEDTLPGPSGVRAQAMRRDGSLVEDFVFSGNDRVLHVRNAPSPGATSSLAIARYIADDAARRFGFL